MAVKPKTRMRDLRDSAYAAAVAVAKGIRRAAQALGSAAEGPASHRLAQTSGTLAFNSSSQTRAFPSDGARQSPRGDNEPAGRNFRPIGQRRAFELADGEKSKQKDARANV